MKVVLATNGGLAAREAERMVAAIADPEVVEIYLFCASTMEFVFPEEPYMAGRTPVPRKQPESILRESAEHFESLGFRVYWTQRPGIPADEILGYAHEESADLIVAGAGDQSWSGRVIWGGTATRLLHRSDVSLLIVQEGPDHDVADVLVAADGSEHSQSASRFFARFARADRCRVKVVSVARPEPTPVAEVLGGYMSAPVTKEQVDELLVLAQAIVEVEADRLAGAGFGVSTEVAVGSPAKRLLEVAERDSADLIVAGARGVGLMARLTLGSVSAQLVRHGRAVLVAHDPAVDERS